MQPLHKSYFISRDERETSLKKTDKALLDRGLSNGEKKALYILNIIFEIKARGQSKAETLVVLDDIADSFDYKNKYAIIEYLNDVREDCNFKLVILSHNYDFYRTVRGRLGVYGENKLLSNRSNGSLQLVKDSLSENPFADWKQSLSDPEVLIASIPFVRNLAEYAGREDLSRNLTALLHIKPNTQEISVNQLHDWYKNILAADSFEDFSGSDESVFQTIERACQRIECLAEDDLTLEQKIALSVGIRLAAEQCLIELIAEPDYVAGISKNQTGRLIGKYQKMDAHDPEVVKVMKRVSLMTPENIHLNSFMFEPILDMSGHHLKQLYNSVCTCRDATT